MFRKKRKKKEKKEKKEGPACLKIKNLNVLIKDCYERLSSIFSFKTFKVLYIYRFKCGRK